MFLSKVASLDVCHGCLSRNIGSFKKAPLTNSCYSSLTSKNAAKTSGDGSSKNPIAFVNLKPIELKCVKPSDDNAPLKAEDASTEASLVRSLDERNPRWRKTSNERSLTRADDESKMPSRKTHLDFPLIFGPKTALDLSSVPGPRDLFMRTNVGLKSHRCLEIGSKSLPRRAKSFGDLSGRGEVRVRGLEEDASDATYSDELKTDIKKTMKIVSMMQRINSIFSLSLMESKNRLKDPLKMRKLMTAVDSCIKKLDRGRNAPLLLTKSSSVSPDLMNVFKRVKSHPETEGVCSRSMGVRLPSSVLTKARTMERCSALERSSDRFGRDPGSSERCNRLIRSLNRLGRNKRLGSISDFGVRLSPKVLSRVKHLLGNKRFDAKTAPVASPGYTLLKDETRDEPALKLESVANMKRSFDRFNLSINGWYEPLRKRTRVTATGNDWNESFLDSCFRESSIDRLTDSRDSASIALFEKGDNRDGLKAADSQPDNLLRRMLRVTKMSNDPSFYRNIKEALNKSNGDKVPTIANSLLEKINSKIIYSNGDTLFLMELPEFDCRLSERAREPWPLKSIDVTKEERAMKEDAKTTWCLGWMPNVCETGATRRNSQCSSVDNKSGSLEHVDCDESCQVKKFWNDLSKCLNGALQQDNRRSFTVYIEFARNLAFPLSSDKNVESFKSMKVRPKIEGIEPTDCSNVGSTSLPALLANAIDPLSDETRQKLIPSDSSISIIDNDCTASSVEKNDETNNLSKELPISQKFNYNEPAPFESTCKRIKPFCSLPGIKEEG